ncbi:glycosyltransferase family 4 protein [Cohnella sp. 56]|uniref:glycosyltransferase family 4 protein n=1 Tax=Cohnella sp. 56 TaxID=3113722 RepID=UPI0030E7B333
MQLNILSVHNKYLIRGGEDGSFAAKNALLEQHGHNVVLHVENNTRVEELGKLRTAAKTIWSKETTKTIRSLLRDNRIDLVECENTFPLISPSIYYAARDMGVPIVQNVRNYRLICPNALFFREGRVCEDCLGKFMPWPGVKNKCYKESLGGSATVAAMLTTHRALGTYQNKVSKYIVLTEFARGKLIQAGFPADRITVRPNFVPDPGEGNGEGGFALYVGRLSPEKGIDTMLEAWKLLPEHIPLKIAGDGPLTKQVEQEIAGHRNISYIGARDIEEVYRLMGEARMLIFPSVWYEGLPRTIIESYAKGTPVIASKLGAMESIVIDGVTGAHFEPGKAQHLAAQVELYWHASEKLCQMREHARREFEEKYTADSYYERSLSIYEEVLSSHHEHKKSISH